MKTDPPRVFMKDVARAAKLSVSTVSLALKGHPALKKETIDRVKSLAQEMGYIPDPALSALSSYRSKNGSKETNKVIAYVTNEGKGSNQDAINRNSIIIEAAKERARLLGYKLEVFSVSEDGINGKRLDGILKARGIQSVILDAANSVDHKVCLDWDSYFLSSLGRPACLRGVKYCSNNCFEEFETLVGKLYEADARKVGVVFDVNGSRDCRYAQQSQFPFLELDLELDPFTLFAQVGNWIREHRIDGIVGNKRSIFQMLIENKFFGQEVKAFVSTNVDPADREVAGLEPGYHVLGETVVEIVHRQYVDNQKGISLETIGSLVEGKWKDGMSCEYRLSKRETKKVAN